MPNPPFKVIALYPFTSDVEDDLTFEANQEIQVDTIEDEEWYSGSYTTSDGTEKTGMFPRNFVKVIEKLPLPLVAIPPRPVPTEQKAKESPTATVNEQDHKTDDKEIAPHGLSKTEPSRKGGLTERISTFNLEESAPINPDIKPKEESSVKKQFFASPQSSYVPPSFGKSAGKKEEPKSVPPPINSSVNETSQTEEEAGPKISLKERIALLQKRQQEEAEREAELERRKQEKKELKKKKKSEVSAVAEPESEHPQSQPPVPITTNITGGSQFSMSTQGTNEEHFKAPQIPLPSAPLPVTEENASVPSDDDQVDEKAVGDISGSLPVTHLNKENLSSDEEKENDDDEDDDDDDDDDDEEENEEDEEENRKRALRERMAKLSGGVGMFGMMGQPSPFAASTSSKPKQKKVIKEDAIGAELQAPQPIPGLSIHPPVRESPVEKELLPEVLTDDVSLNDDTPVPALITSAELEEDESTSVTNPTDEEEDTVNEERPLAPAPPVPEASTLDAKPEIKDHEFETDDQAVEHSSESFEEEQEKSLDHQLPGVPVHSVMETNTTGYDADDDDTDAPSLLLPPIPQTRPDAPPPPHTLLPPSIDSIPPPPVPVIPAPPPATTSAPPPIPAIPPPISRAQTFEETSPTAEFHDAVPVRRSSTQREKAAPPPVPAASTHSIGGLRRSIDLSRRSIDTARRASTINSEVAHSNVELDLESGWWINSELPPSIASEIGKNAIFEVDTHTLDKRAGRKVIYRDYYILYHDLSQLVIEVNYAINDPFSTVSFKQFEIAAPVGRKDKLDKLSIEYGTQVLNLAESLGTANIGANRLVPYIFDKLVKRYPILPAIGNKGYGALIFKYNSAEDSTKYDEIRPGDILCLKAKFVSHSKLRQKSTIDVGVGEVHSCIIYEYEPAKQKFRVIETDQSGKIVKGSYKLGDFKSGKLRVFRVVGRDYINWV